jgi:hypothetical protein
MGIAHTPRVGVATGGRAALGNWQPVLTRPRFLRPTAVAHLYEDKILVFVEPLFFPFPSLGFRSSVAIPSGPSSDGG